LVSQSYPNLEIVVVDNHSKDETVEIAKRFTSKIIRSQTLRSAARNQGFRAAEGDFLLFLDADMETTDLVIEECVSTALNGGIDAVMIPEIRRGEGYWAKCREIERQLYVGDPLIESVRFVSRPSFEKIGGYDEELEAGEDWDLHARIEDSGLKVASVRAPIIHEEGRRTLREMAAKRYYYGKSMRKYIRKQSRRAAKQFVPIRPNFIRRRKILLQNPFYAAGIIFMKSVEWYTTAISLMISSLP
jgi:glycosyltransferase involved in cell wall biosynthesis